jgi:hypothetical protein
VKIRRHYLVSLVAVIGLLAAVPAGAAQAAPAPAWNLNVTPLPSNFSPGAESELLVTATNIGGSSTEGTSVLHASFPPTVTPTKISPQHSSVPPEAVACTIAGHEVTCETSEPIASSKLFSMLITVAVPPGTSGTATMQAAVSGGEAGDAASTVSTPLQEASVPFAISEPGLRAPLTEADGTAATLAGSHPFQQTLSFGFPSLSAEGGELTNDGHPHEIKIDLPPGLIGDPAATPVLCTEVQLTDGHCPPASQIGIFNLTTAGAGKNFAAAGVAPFYNMVPPPGTPAELGFNVENIGIFVHVFATVRTDGDYGIEVTSSDVLALGTEPLFNIQTQIWGDASDPSHPVVCDGVNPTLCPQPQQKTAFWTLPARCTGQPDHSSVRADSWEERRAFVGSGYESADLGGTPVSVTDCAALEFKPTISAQPTTNLTDSPSGLDVDLHQPQDTGLGENDEGRSTAQLKDAVVTLPAGMSVNPSQADGLAACSSQQIGLETAIGVTPIHFDRNPNACPDAAKLGTVAVTSPLLAEYEEDGTKLATDPETGDAIPRPLHGSVYLAQPFDNPFGSLLAIYLAIEDPRSGIVAKLAGQIEPDPVTGQLTTTFSENPQLPIEDIGLHLFKGARAPLITPPTCTTHTTSTELVPWSWSPTEGSKAFPASSFQTTASPAGGACPASADALPNAPAFTAGTIGRQAGAYSPFSLKLSREDGSARLVGLDTMLPSGLTGKLAGIPECPEAAIAQAQARSRPNEGILERRSPSCPASSALGTVNVGAGAGPTPFYTQGTAYLAGPYKGAPLSLAIVTPAIAGPFDLGTVVVRVALNVDPFTAQIHAVSDPFPQILDGIPLDIRSVALQMDRPGFILNPTSCDPMAITGSAVSTLGLPATLSTPFQVGGCSSLKFKPSLTLKLKGGTKRADLPALTAKLTYPKKGAYANIASAQVNLPHSEFLEQGHIGTVCTRPQLASHTCPAKSVYGFARAVTPLLDEPLEGPVYLGVGFGHKLPDLVADLNGQIEVLLHGKTDTGKNHGLRNTFEVVPDAPVTSFTLSLFGGKRGLIVNSENLCSPKAKTQAFAHFVAQNGTVLDLKPQVQNECGGKKGKGAHGSRGR